MNLKRLSVILAIAVTACTPAGTTDSSREPAERTITADALHDRLQSGGAKPLLVDVREPAEFDEVRIDGAQLAPLGSVVEDLEDVPKDREIVLICRSGNRSGKAQKALAERGYTGVTNMEGGMLAWEKRGYPVVRR